MIRLVAGKLKAGIFFLFSEKEDEPGTSLVASAIYHDFPSPN